VRLPGHWIWDFWFAVDGDDLHIFFLHAPRDLGHPDLRHGHAKIGHAVSRDLHTWEVLPTAPARRRPRSRTLRQPSQSRWRPAVIGGVGPRWSRRGAGPWPAGSRAGSRRAVHGVPKRQRGGAVRLGAGHPERGVQDEAVELPWRRPALGALNGAVNASPSTSAGHPFSPYRSATRSSVGPSVALVASP
jgi:hypothetical protein